MSRSATRSPRDCATPRACPQGSIAGGRTGWRSCSRYRAGRGRFATPTSRCAAVPSRSSSTSSCPRRTGSAPIWCRCSSARTIWWALGRTSRRSPPRSTARWRACVRRGAMSCSSPRSCPIAARRRSSRSASPGSTPSSGGSLRAPARSSSTSKRTPTWGRRRCGQTTECICARRATASSRTGRPMCSGCRMPRHSRASTRPCTPTTSPRRRARGCDGMRCRGCGGGCRAGRPETVGRPSTRATS